MNENLSERSMTAKVYATVVLATLLLSGGTPIQAAPTHASVYSAQQQTKKVTGKITDSSGDPVIGATVTVKGTKTVAVTDANGNYTINAPAGSQLEVTYVGFAPRTINVGKGGTYDITIREDEHTTGEVVVTAMGIKKEKKALGYAVTELNSAEILKNKNTNVINSLAGKVPGLNITQSSGAAGAGATIVMRGANSTAEGRSNQPLFVVDGVIYDNSTQVTGNSGTDGMTRNNTTFSNRAMDINPEDIADISVLKGAAAAALYGSRAADGAIIITTKKGEAGSVRIDYTGKVSVLSTQTYLKHKRLSDAVFTQTTAFSAIRLTNHGVKPILEQKRCTTILAVSSRADVYLTTTYQCLAVQKIIVSIFRYQTLTKKVS